MGDDFAFSLTPEIENASLSSREMVDDVDMDMLMELWHWLQRVEKNQSIPGDNFDGFPMEGGKDVVYPTAKAALGVVYSLIIMVCGVGNTLLLLVLFKYKKTRNTANLLIANLALSDLIVAVCCIPFDVDYYVVRPRVWVHGDAACAVVNFVKTVSMYVSTNALLVIALDRYIVLYHPDRRMGSVLSMLAVGLVWGVSLLVSVPTALYSVTISAVGGDGAICVQMWPIRQYRASRAYFLFTIVGEFALPVLVMGVCCVLVVRKVWRRILPGQRTDAQRRLLARSRRKVVQLAVKFFMFVVCWGPYHGVIVARDFFPSSSIATGAPGTFNVFYIVEAVAMSNSVINTLVYVGFNTSVMAHLGELICLRSDRNARRAVVTLQSYRATVNEDRVSNGTAHNGTRRVQTL
ncbi:prokineticin receptor 2-like [Branchiostoma lanceolatum]|uniref:prokineticin receptor 2-like n=1 Tax=Branchiostoma lanceolatum TaxID=7740 RepID=UPI003451F543